MASRRFYMQNSSVGRNSRRGGGAWRLDVDNAPGESRAGLGFGKSSHVEPSVAGSVGEPLADELSSVDDRDSSSIKPVSSFDEKVAEVDAKLASFLAEINSLPSVEPSSDGQAGIADSAPVSGDTLTSPKENPPEENPSFYGSVGEGKSSILFVKSKEVLVPTLQLATSAVESHTEDSLTDTAGLSHAETMQEPVTVWQHCFDESTQYYYFWNTETNEVTWEIPDEYSNYLSKKKLYDEWYSHKQEAASAEATAQHSLDSVTRTHETRNVDANDTAPVDSLTALRHDASTESVAAVTSSAISAPAHAGGTTVRRAGLVMYAGSDSGSDEDDDGEGIGACSIGRVSTSFGAASSSLAVQPPPPPPPDLHSQSTSTVTSDGVSSDVVLLCSAGISVAQAARGVCTSAKGGDAEVVGVMSVAAAEPAGNDDGRRDVPSLDDTAVASVVYGPVEAPVDFHDTAAAPAGVIGDIVGSPPVKTADTEALRISSVGMPLMGSAAGELGSIVAALEEVSCPGDSADGALAPTAPSADDIFAAPAASGEQLAAAGDVVLVAGYAEVVPDFGNNHDASLPADRASSHLAFKSYEDVENIAQPVGPDEPLVFRPLPTSEHAAEVAVSRAGRAGGRAEARRRKRDRAAAAAAAEQMGPSADGEELPSYGKDDGEATGFYAESVQSGKRQRLNRDGMDAGRRLADDAAVEAAAENRGIPEAEVEAGEGDLTTLSSTVLEKLAFFDVSYDRLSPLQLLLVQTRVRLDDWQSGGLDRGYLLRRLREADMTIRDYEQYAVPPGWSCHWDSTHKRYFYLNEVTEEVQWEYPEDGFEEIMKCAAAAAMHEGSAHAKAGQPAGRVPRGGVSSTVRRMSDQVAHDADTVEVVSQASKRLFLSKLAGATRLAQHRSHSASHDSDRSSPCRAVGAHHSHRLPDGSCDSSDGRDSPSAADANVLSSFEAQQDAASAAWHASTDAASALQLLQQHQLQWKLQHDAQCSASLPQPALPPQLFASTSPPPPPPLLPPPPPPPPPPPELESGGTTPLSPSENSPPARRRRLSASPEPDDRTVRRKARQRHAAAASTSERTGSGRRARLSCGATPHHDGDDAPAADDCYRTETPMADAGDSDPSRSPPLSLGDDLESCYDSFMAEVDSLAAVASSAGLAGGGSSHLTSKESGSKASAKCVGSGDIVGQVVPLESVVTQADAASLATDRQTPTVTPPAAAPAVIYGAPVTFHSVTTRSHLDSHETGARWSETATPSSEALVTGSSGGLQTSGAPGPVAARDTGPTATAGARHHLDGSAVDSTTPRPNPLQATAAAAACTTVAPAGITSAAGAPSAHTVGEKKKKDKDKSKKSSGKQPSSKKSSIPTLVQRWQQVREEVAHEIQLEKQVLEKLRKEAL